MSVAEKKQVIEDLAATISAWSLSSTRTLMAEMYEVLIEKGITREQDYKLHLEMLTFFMLSFERYALGAGGENLLNLLLNETADWSIRLLLDEIEPGFDSSDGAAIKRALDYYNEAARDYDYCPALVEKKPDYEGKRTVLGRLSNRIAEILQTPNIAEFGDIVSVVAAEALAESALKAKVEKAAALQY
ncbi:MAG: hypothetical protein JW954_00140 [Dehalococcoidaceae bacterium]|nr:hypothetical protein [Dehalococcoidaceae bacterium]